MKIQALFVVYALLFYNLCIAQNTLKPSPVIVITFERAAPRGDSLDFKPDSIVNYYVDKGIRPNNMVKNFRILRHWWGGDSYKTMFIMELDKLENIQNTEDEIIKLINASFKNETEKKTFWRNWRRLFDRHEDNIMMDAVKPKM